MNLVDILITVLVAWLCVYSIVVRICECVEKRKLYEVYGRYFMNTKKSDWGYDDFITWMRGALKANGKPAGRNAESGEK